MNSGRNKYINKKVSLKAAGPVGIQRIKYNKGRSHRVIGKCGHLSCPRLARQMIDDFEALRCRDSHGS